MKPILLIAVVSLTGCGLPVLAQPKSATIPGELVVTKIVERVEVPVVKEVIKEVPVEKIVEKIVEVPAKRVPVADGGKGFVDPTPKINSYQDAVKVFDGTCENGQCNQPATNAMKPAANVQESQPQRRGLFRRRGG